MIVAKFNIRVVITKPDHDIRGFEVAISGHHLQKKLVLADSGGDYWTGYGRDHIRDERRYSNC
jgi:hypothetical protein